MSRFLLILALVAYLAEGHILLEDVPGVAVEIQDSGPGVPAELRESLLKEFFLNDGLSRFHVLGARLYHFPQSSLYPFPHNIMFETSDSKIERISFNSLL